MNPGPKRRRTDEEEDTNQHLAAAVDVGTHSARVLVASFGRDGRFSLMDDLRIPTGLGVGLQISGCISPRGRRNLENALEMLFRVAPRTRFRTISLVATSALRLAANGTEILESIQRRFGIPAAIITGDEEARLVCRSAIFGLGLASRPFTLIDLGAGSVELVVTSREPSQLATSLDVGAQYLSDLIQKTDPLSPSEWCAMSDHIRSTLLATPAGRRRFPSRGIGTGGTFTTLANVHRQEVGSHAPLHGYLLKAEDIETLALRLAFSPQVALRTTRGISIDRAGIVPAGMCLAFQLVRHLGLKDVTVCDRGLREGLLMDIIEKETGMKPTPRQRSTARNDIL